MEHKYNVKQVSMMGAVLLIVLFNQPTQVQASANLSFDGGHHDRHGRYTEVVVGNSRYYYDQGVFYTGDPGHYVVIEAPVGAVVYNVPSNYERVEIDGAHYFRHGNVYYRPSGRGYEVVRVNRSGGHEDRHGRDGDKH